MGARRDLRTMLLRFVLVVVYVVFGAAVFYAIEHRGDYDDEVERKKQLLNSTKYNIMQRFHLNQTDFQFLVSALMEANSDTPLDWSFSRGLDLSWQAVTTIGYGNKTPVTTAGQLFLIPFALFGVPLTAFMLQTVGENICHCITYIITKVEKNVLKREQVKRLHTKACLVNVVLTFGLIFVMAGVSTHFDEWTFAQGLYVWFVTFSTIGFGDYIPGSTSDGTSGISVVLYRVIFVVLGLSLLSTIINSIADLAASRKEPTCQACFCFTSCCPKKDEDTETNGRSFSAKKDQDNNGTDRGLEMQQYI